MWMNQNNFVVVESDWTLSEDFNSFMYSISYNNVVKFVATFSKLNGLTLFLIMVLDASNSRFIPILISILKCLNKQQIIQLNFFIYIFPASH